MGEELDFGYRTVIKLFEWNGKPVGFTTTIVNTWIIMAVLIIVALIIRKKLESFEEVPETKFQNIVETIIEAIDGIVTGAMAKKTEGSHRFMDLC